MNGNVVQRLSKAHNYVEVSRVGHKLMMLEKRSTLLKGDDIV